MASPAAIPRRRYHQTAVAALLQREFGAADWRFELPPGSGHETYFAFAGSQSLFVKLGAQNEQYRALAAADLGPEVLFSGVLDDGTSLLVQPLVPGRTPQRADFQNNLAQVAPIVGAMHRNAALQAALPASTDCSGAGLRVLASVRRRWEFYRPQLAPVADFVDGALHALASGIAGLVGGDLVAAHGDICNANWLLTPEGRFYILDTDAMSLDDPTADLGPLLWWYYPPEQRASFLALAGYGADETLPQRLYLLTALHCLNITLPRENSFDTLDPQSYAAKLVDFRAAFAGEQNPQGY